MINFMMKVLFEIEFFCAGLLEAMGLDLFQFAGIVAILGFIVVITGGILDIGAIFIAGCIMFGVGTVWCILDMMFDIT